jgi:hypothetical protein
MPPVYQIWWLECDYTHYKIWKPFGDYVNKHFDLLERGRVEDIYNYPLYDYETEGKWHCPIYITIKFFDIMIPEGLFQGIQWHMWLYYFPHFVDKIIRNIILIPNVDFDREWPTPYHYLLYTIVSVMCDWIEATKGIPIDQPNIVLSNTRIDHENGNIPKSTIIALGQIVYSIIKTRNIDLKFKTYICSSICYTIKRLNEDDKTKHFASLLIKAMVVGGYENRTKSKEHLIELMDCFKNMDHMLQYYTKDFEKAVSAEILK